MEEMKITPINNVDVEADSDSKIQSCIVTCNSETSDSADVICCIG